MTIQRSVHAIVMEMLDAGDAYRLGYGAVLSAPRDIPAARCNYATRTNHLPMTATRCRRISTGSERCPPRWEARKVDNAGGASGRQHRLFGRGCHRSAARLLKEDTDRGFVRGDDACCSSGLLHWQGKRGARRAGPACARTAKLSSDSRRRCRSICPDMGFRIAVGMTKHRPNVVAVLASRYRRGCEDAGYRPRPAYPAKRKTGDPDTAVPRTWLLTASVPISPRRGASSARVVSSRRGTKPAPQTRFRSTRPVIDPAALAKDHRALIRATAVRAYHQALLQREGN